MLEDMKFANTTQCIAKGDYCVSVEYPAKDIIGDVAQSLSHMIETTRSAIQVIIEAANGIDSKAISLAQLAQDMLQNAQAGKDGANRMLQGIQEVRNYMNSTYSTGIALRSSSCITAAGRNKVRSFGDASSG